MNKHEKRKTQPIFTGVLMYFPRAIRYVSEVSYQGSKQHHPDEPMHWDLEKSKDEKDALVRHLIDAGPDGTAVDDDDILHAGKVAWRALANLERILMEHDTN